MYRPLCAVLCAVALSVAHVTPKQAAGFYESYVTATQIEQFAFNSGLYDYQPPAGLSQYLTRNQAFMSKMINETASLPASNADRTYWY